jgi:hypothetical protein
MSERTHFRCHAYGLLSVAQCRANRAARLRLACVDCGRRAAVDAGTEPSLTTLAALAAPHRLRRTPTAQTGAGRCGRLPASDAGHTGAGLPPADLTDGGRGSARRGAAAAPAGHDTARKDEHTGTGGSDTG